MDELPRKGPGRPRKPVAVPDATAQGQDSSGHDDGDRKTGGTGLAAQADDSAARESGLVVNEALFSAFLVRLDAFICSHGTGYVISATHPDADGETLESDYPVTITKGPARAVTAYCERQVTI